MRNPLSNFIPDFSVAQSGNDASIESPKLTRPVILATILVGSLELGVPLTVLQVYDRILPNQSTHTMALMIFGLVGVMILAAVIKIVRSIVMGWTAASFGHRAQVEAVTRVINAPSYKLEDETASAHISRFTALQALGNFFGGQARLLSIEIPIALVFLLVMAMIGGPIVLAPIVLLAIFVVLTLRSNARLQSIVEERADQDARKYDFVLEVLSGIHTIKTHAMESLMMRRFERLQRQVGQWNFQAIELSNDSQSKISFYSTFSTVCVAVVGAILAIGGSLSVGGLAACILLTGQVIQPFLRGIGIWTDLQRVRHDHAEAMHLYALPAVPVPPKLTREPTGTLRIEGVFYSHTGKRRRLLQDISFAVEARQIIGLKGADGSGRSTMMRIISGELAPQRGAIYLDGESLFGPLHDALRSRIAYVGAHESLFRGTILENLTMFGSVAEVDIALQAATLIGLDREIHQLPMGYETSLGSGIIHEMPASTIQRIAIARALATQPSILILDEANSMLDQRSEADLVEALNLLRGRLTVLIVSHRPSFLAVADRQLEFTQAGVIEIEANPRPRQEAG